MTGIPKLRDPSLLKEACFVGGEWVTEGEDGTLSVRNPSNGQTVARVPRMGGSATRRAIAQAQEALPAWRSATAQERASVLRRWQALMIENQEDLATIMTAEQGKPLAESRGEISYAASFLEWFAEEAKRAYGDVVPATSRDRRILVLKQPVGVCAAITPWNFPAAMITRKAGPALAAGCTMVVKPASQTPMSALALAALAERAGVPKGVLSVVVGASDAIGQELTSSPIVKKLSFTGSTEIGKVLLEQCARTIKRTSMELGGNAPFIVFDDADLDSAVAGAIASKYRNAGQTCICVNRILVQSIIYDEFVTRFSAAVRNLQVGDGFSAGVTLGPLIDDQALNKVQEHIQDATSKGAKIAAGGRRHQLGRTFFEPTVISEAAPDMLIFNEETFGPVAPIFRFDTEDEAIALANNTEFGLAAYFYGRDMGRVWRVAEALEYGMVGINEAMISTEVAPFGGMKQSGHGREGSRYGINEYLDIKYLCMGGLGDGAR